MSMANLISQLCDELHVFVKGRWSHLKTTLALVDTRQASETRNNESSLGNFQHQYLAELLVNVYSSVSFDGD